MSLADIAYWIVILSGAWLVLVAGLMAFRPDWALKGLAQMGANWAMQLGEHIPRAIAGAAMIGIAPASKAPLFLMVAGGFIVFSSVLILILPMRWHHAYAAWWAERIPRWAVRTLAPLSLAAGAGLIWLVI